MPRAKRKASEMDEDEEVDETPRKMTKREKRALAIARAQKSMEDDKRRVEAVKAKKAGKPIPEEPKPSAKKKAKTASAKDRPKKSSRATRTHQRAATASNDEDASDEDVKPAAEPALTPSTVQQSQPIQAPLSMKAPPSYGQTIVAPAAAPAANDDDDDDEMPPPMPTLEAQISQRVLANMAATEENKPTPYTQPPPAAFTNPPEVEGDEVDDLVHDDDPIVIDDVYVEDSKPKRSFGIGSVFAVAIIAIFFGFIAIQEDDGTVDIGETASIETPCFKDNIMVDASGVVINSCAGNTGLDCPDGGTCKFGKLVECIGKHYEISGHRDKCVLTSRSKDKVSAITDVLEEKTLEGGCHLAADEYPMFLYKDVQLANPMDIANDALEISILENEFNVERTKGDLYIGLPADFELKQPFHCKATTAMASMLGSFGSMLISLFHFLFAIALEIFRAYPIPCSIILVAGSVIRRILQYRSYRKQLREDVSEIRQIAYDYLSDSAEQSHLVLHVRDHIVMNLYPKKKRKYLIKAVWPRVVPDFRYDNRIRKSTRAVEGQPREAWQWVAAVAAKKKPLHIQ